jgi:hypothetical protein
VSRQQAAQQALDRLRQASDDMGRAASGAASAADSRRAADRLREATELLGRTQQQDAALASLRIARAPDGGRTLTGNFPGHWRAGDPQS